MQQCVFFSKKLNNMKKLILLIICISSIIAIKCLGQSKYRVDTTFYTKENSIIIDNLETLKKINLNTATSDYSIKFSLSKAEFNHIVGKLPELYQFPPRTPYETYENSPLFGDSTYFEDEQLRYYRSEGGQDQYYLLYTYFLKMKNGAHKFAEQRNKLIEIGYVLNYLNSYFSGGGTMYIHSYRRILANIEFMIYQLSENDSSFNVTINFENEKEKMLNSIKAKILECNENEIDSIEKSIFAAKNINMKSIKSKIKGDKKIIDEFFDCYTSQNLCSDRNDLEYEYETTIRMRTYRNKLLLEKVRILEKSISNYYYFKWAQLFIR